MRKECTEEEVNFALKSGVDLEAKWRDTHRKDIEDAKKVFQFFKELDDKKQKRVNR
jgi:hypothetical protein